MRGSSFAYLVRHGIQSLKLNRMMAIASIGILAACLVITSGAGIIAASAAGIFENIEGKNEIVVFIKDEADADATLTLKNQILAIDGVAEVTYTSRAQAFQNEKDKLGEDSHLFDGLDPESVFPASYTVKLTSNSLMKQVVQQLEPLENVDTVSAMLSVAETLSSVGKALVIFAVVIIAILVIVSIVVISNAIRLSVFARRREINIMKYVGATNSFIRLPFVVEGVFIGAIAAVAAFFVLWGLCALLASAISNPSTALLSEFSNSIVNFKQVWYIVAAYDVVFGALIGALASSASIRRHLKV